MRGGGARGGGGRLGRVSWGFPSVGEVFESASLIRDCTVLASTWDSDEQHILYHTVHVFIHSKTMESILAKSGTDDERKQYILMGIKRMLCCT